MYSNKDPLSDTQSSALRIIADTAIACYTMRWYEPKREKGFEFEADDFVTYQKDKLLKELEKLGYSKKDFRQLDLDGLLDPQYSKAWGRALAISVHQQNFLYLLTHQNFLNEIQCLINNYQNRLKKKTENPIIKYQKKLVTSTLQVSSSLFATQLQRKEALKSSYILRGEASNSILSLLKMSETKESITAWAILTATAYYLRYSLGFSLLSSLLGGFNVIALKKGASKLFKAFSFSKMTYDLSTESGKSLTVKSLYPVQKFSGIYHELSETHQRMNNIFFCSSILICLIIGLLAYVLGFDSIISGTIGTQILNILFSPDFIKLRSKPNMTLNNIPSHLKGGLTQEIIKHWSFVFSSPDRKVRELRPPKAPRLNHSPKVEGNDKHTTATVVVERKNSKAEYRKWLNLIDQFPIKLVPLSSTEPPCQIKITWMTDHSYTVRGQWGKGQKRIGFLPHPQIYQVWGASSIFDKYFVLNAVDEEKTFLFEPSEGIAALKSVIENAHVVPPKGDSGLVYLSKQNQQQFPGAIFKAKLLGAWRAGMFQLAEASVVCTTHEKSPQSCPIPDKLLDNYHLLEPRGYRQTH